MSAAARAAEQAEAQASTDTTTASGGPAPAPCEVPQSPQQRRAALRDSMRRTAALVRPEPVDVPGWGRVYVRAQTVAEVDANTVADKDADPHMRMARGLARVIVDADGALMFDEASAEDVALIAAQPWPLMQKLVERSNSFNGMGEAGEAEAGNA